MTTETSTLPPPVIDYVWNYVSSTVGGQSTLPPIWWLTTVILLSAILYCYRKRPHALAIPKNGLSATVLTVFINHLVNNAVFIVSTYVINYIANYNRPVFDANKWLNTWYHSFRHTFETYRFSHTFWCCQLGAQEKLQIGKVSWALGAMFAEF